jgi:hypothetical protein
MGELLSGMPNLPLTSVALPVLVPVFSSHSGDRVSITLVKDTKDWEM